ncbi:GNAT family N-acetyltransferase [Rhizobium leguminosarum]|uniref:GNAT family N-acetyltransferase n=1 Tax=Rhizobium leguminosarum TaxID=384 RepID=UPI001C987EDB|nr:GNAT family N-acetyltransferase [Rhizobium leguminosarum]MBY5814527.1 GNAT family N-acetyltransferase [Rhizobium leguminosarum]
MANPSVDVNESVSQLADTWESIVLDYGAGYITNRNSLAFRWADSKFSFFNCITLMEHLTDIDSLNNCLTSSARYMHERSEPGFLWLFEEMLDPEIRTRIPEAASASGLHVALTGYGMALDEISPDSPSHPDLTFVRVDTDDDLLHYADINSLAYGMPIESGRDGLRDSDLWRNEAYAYLGIYRGEPVSAAASIQTNGRLFLALVATRPDMQRKGFGEATVQKALYEGSRATGIKRSVLHATEAGRPVYERIGYRQTSTIRFLTLKN